MSGGAGRTYCFAFYSAFSPWIGIGQWRLDWAAWSEGCCGWSMCCWCEFTPRSLVCTTGLSCNPEYSFAVNGHCSDKKMFITTAQECQWAFRSLQAQRKEPLEVLTSWPYRVSWVSASDYPSGCHYKTSRTKLYFNEFEGQYDNTDTDMIALCKGKTGLID